MRRGVKSYREFISESVKYPDSLLSYARKFKSSEDLLRSGGFKDADLQNAAYGFTDELDEIDPRELNIKWKSDLANVRHEVRESGLSAKEWSKKVSLDAPVDVFYKDGKFWLDDGHHRYFAAKTLGKKLKMSLQIKDNPINALGGEDYDRYHRDAWNKAKSR
jgi:hypothetical protein